MMTSTARFNTHIGSEKQQSSLVGRLSEQSAQVACQVSSLVEERPLTAITVAFSAGLVVGVGAVLLYAQSNPSPESSYASLTHRLMTAIRSIPHELPSFQR